MKKHYLLLTLPVVALAACGGGGKSVSVLGSNTTTSALSKTVKTCTDPLIIDVVTEQFKYPEIVTQLAKEKGVSDAEWMSGLVDELASVSADDTLVLSNAGQQYDEGDEVTDVGLLSLAIEQCVLDDLEAPTSVREHIGTTRALDGQQTDRWGSYQARWTYHPDDGLNLTITAV